MVQTLGLLIAFALRPHFVESLLIVLTQLLDLVQILVLQLLYLLRMVRLELLYGRLQGTLRLFTFGLEHLDSVDEIAAVFLVALQFVLQLSLPFLSLLQTFSEPTAFDLLSAELGPDFAEDLL